MSLKKNISLDIALSAAIPAIIVTLAYITKSFWGDEILSIQVASQSFVGSLSLIVSDYHPPLYFLLLKVWLRLFGDGELVVRIFQGLVGYALLSFSLMLFRKIFPSHRFHLFWLLFATSSELWLFMPMLRYYALAAALVVVSTYIFFNWLELHNRRNSFLLLLTYVAIVYADYPSSVIIPFHLLYIALKRRELLRKLFSIAVLAGVCFLPWLWITITQIQSLMHEHRLADFNASPFSIVLKIGYSFYAFLAGEMIYPFEVVGALGILILLVLIVLAFKKKILFVRDFSVYALGFVFVGILFTSLVTTFISTHTSFIYTPSRTFFGLPFVFIILGLVYEQFEQRFLKIALLATMFLVNVYGDVNWMLNRHFLMPVYATPWKQVMRDVEHQHGWMIADESLCYEYYQHHLSSSFPQSKIFSSVSEFEQAIKDSTPTNIFLLQMGRESTESGIPHEVEQYIKKTFKLTSTSKYLSIDESYREVKSKLLKRNSYDAKVTLYHFIPQ